MVSVVTRLLMSRQINSLSGMIGGMSARGPGCVKTHKLERDENDILEFGFEIEWPCGVSAYSGLEQITSSIAIGSRRLFTQPGPIASFRGNAP